MTQKTQVGLIVEGYTEEESFRSTLDEKLHDIHIRRSTLNGRTVSVEAMAIKISRILNALSKTGTSINIIVIDREKRHISVNEMKTKLKEFISHNFKGNVAIFIPDIMFENWVIADLDNLKSKFPDYFKYEATSEVCNEGKSGIGVIQKFWKSKESYNKLSHGPRLFKSIRKDHAIKHSRSLCDFIEFLYSKNISIHLS